MIEPYYEDDQVTLHHGDALEVLRMMPADSVDAVVCDPPYSLDFMGNDWDRHPTPLDFQIWCRAWATECLRVLKPGGHLLAFGGTRTVHRLTCGIEDAGFEIRDGIDWLYGQGFPKSLDVSKAIDKGRRRDYVFAAVDLGLEVPGNNLHDWTKAEHAPSDAWWERFKAHLTPDQWGEIERKVTGVRERKATGRMAQGEGGYAFGEQFTDTAPATDAAQRWAGWGTALKPAREPIVMARKPIGGTVAANVLAYGTGALNIDACRTGSEQRTNHAGGASSLQRVSRVEQGYRSTVTASVGEGSTVTGRWPTNVVLSHVGNDVDGDLCATGCVPGCPVAELDRQSGVTSSGSRKAGSYGLMGYMGADAAPMPAIAGDFGGASRFFPAFRYEAKAPTSERPKVDGEAHATVKPLALMRWLVQLVTPLGGLVLEPFAGSGTTVEACLVEGYRCIAVEREAKYLQLIMSRISKPIEPTLFGGVA